MKNTQTLEQCTVQCKGRGPQKNVISPNNSLSIRPQQDSLCYLYTTDKTSLFCRMFRNNFFSKMIGKNNVSND